LSQARRNAEGATIRRIVGERREAYRSRVVSTPRLLLAAWIAFVATLAPRATHAAACCSSATSGGVGRLLIWEDFALGLQLGHARSLGQADAAGALRWNPAGFSDGLTTAMPWGIVRVHERVQLQGWAPVVLNDRASAGTRQQAWGFGDVGGAARFELLSIGEYQWLPSFAITTGLVAPTGRRVEQTSPPLFAGTTGRGAWGASVAVEAEYAYLPWFARVDASAYRFLAFRRSDTGQSQQYGLLWAAGLSGGLELVPDRLIAALGVRRESEGALRLDGAEVADSAARLWSFTASLAWRLEPHWTATVAVTTTVWPDGWNANRDARLGGTLGLRYGYF
jgi:hypothetical protein